MTLQGEKIYESDVDITGVTDYGLTMEDVLAGRKAVPPQGARYDLAFAGLMKGRISGSMRGVDYLAVRADGRMDLGLRGTIETNDGSRIAFSADGVATPREGEPVCRPGRQHTARHRRAGLLMGQHTSDLGRGQREPGHGKGSRRGLPAMTGGCRLLRQWFVMAQSARAPGPPGSWW